MQKFFKDYFTFTKKERTGVVILLVLIVFAIILPHFFSIKHKPAQPNAGLLLAMQQLQQKDSLQENNNTTPSENNNEVLHYEMFIFNPNTATAGDWKKLGLKDKTIHTILNYVNKGGKFYKPEDIRKIWGLQKDEADRLIPYINIENSFTTKTNKPFNQFSKKDKAIPIVDLNSATPQDLIRLPVSDKLICYKIINYRNKLGGFIHINQVKETYGMTDSVFNSIQKYLTVQNTGINKININTAPDFVLAAHPYIGRTAGKAIAIYRGQHGNYSKIEDVKKIVFITETAFQKMAPYITVN